MVLFFPATRPVVLMYILCFLSFQVGMCGLPTTFQDKIFAQRAQDQKSSSRISANALVELPGCLSTLLLSRPENIESYRLHYEMFVSFNKRCHNCCVQDQMFNSCVFSYRGGYEMCSDIVCGEDCVAVCSIFPYQFCAQYPINTLCHWDYAFAQCRIGPTSLFSYYAYSTMT